MTSTLRPLFILLFTTALVFALYVVRVLGPSDLMDNDQQRHTAYVLDAFYSNHWIVMTDHTGDVMSTPPVSAWWTALLAVPFERINLWLLYLPCAFSVLFVVWIILSVGTQHFGRLAGFLAALAYILSPVVNKQIALARSDPVFAFLVFATAMALHQAWIRGRGWWLVGLLGALSVLTKGPLGLLLAAGGLVAIWQERKGDSPARLLGYRWVGLILAVGLPLLWFWLAFQEIGWPLVDKMIGKELVGHAVGGRGDLPFVNFWKPPLYFVSRYFPWSLLACYGLWRVMRRPAGNPLERRFERFLFWYFVVGITLFSIAPHQSPDHLFPLIPAAALLAGRELSHWLEGWSTRKVIVCSTALAMVFLAGVGLYGKYVLANKLEIRQTEAVREFAEVAGDVLGKQPDVVFKVVGIFPGRQFDVPYAFDFFAENKLLIYRLGRLHTGHPPWRTAYTIRTVELEEERTGADSTGRDYLAVSEEVDGFQLALLKTPEGDEHIRTGGHMLGGQNFFNGPLFSRVAKGGLIWLVFVLLARFGWHSCYKSLTRGRASRMGLL